MSCVWLGQRSADSLRHADSGTVRKSRSRPHSLGRLLHYTGRPLLAMCELQYGHLQSRKHPVGHWHSQPLPPSYLAIGNEHV
jgi:hypothetical protein